MKFIKKTKEKRKNYNNGRKHVRPISDFFLVFNLIQEYRFALGTLRR